MLQVIPCQSWKNRSWDFDWLIEAASQPYNTTGNREIHINLHSYFRSAQRIVFLLYFLGMLGSCLGSINSASMHLFPGDMSWNWQDKKWQNIRTKYLSPLSLTYMLPIGFFDSVTKFPANNIFLDFYLSVVHCKAINLNFVLVIVLGA